MIENINLEEMIGNYPDGSNVNPRIIQYKGTRYCIRLEDIYWAVLEAEAEAKKTKLNKLIHDYYTHPKGEGNKTAFLRRHSLDWLAKNFVKAQEQLRMENTEIRSVLRAIPQPGFVFSLDMSIARYNQPFRKWLEEHAKSDDPEFLAKMRISFRASVRTLMSRLKEADGMISGEQAAILLPGYVYPVSLNVISLKNYQGSPAFVGILREKAG